jgi:hypothetical protein
MSIYNSALQSQQPFRRQMLHSSKRNLTKAAAMVKELLRRTIR